MLYLTAALHSRAQKSVWIDYLGMMHWEDCYVMMEFSDGL